MKRRWFLGQLGLAGLMLSPAIAAMHGCTRQSGKEAEDGSPLVRSGKVLVVATSADYPPYEQLESGTNSERIVGFDIDLAELIADYLGRELSVVNLEAFDEIIPALVNDEVDMAIAAIEPTRSRRQRVDFSDIYYRSRQALVSFEGYLRSRDLEYQTIAVRAGSVQARFANRLSDDYPDIDLIPYDTLEEVFEALDIGAVEAAILEASIAENWLEDYPDFGMQIVQSDQPTGSAIALPKNSPLRQRVNEAIESIKSSGEMSQLIDKWFS